MNSSNKLSKIIPICLTIMAVCNFIAGILSIPSGLGIFMIITSAICALSAIFSWKEYLRKTNVKS